MRLVLSFALAFLPACAQDLVECLAPGECAPCQSCVNGACVTDEAARCGLKDAGTLDAGASQDMGALDLGAQDLGPPPIPSARAGTHAGGGPIEGTLMVRVVDRISNTPLAGARVLVIVSGETLEGVTDEVGEVPFVDSRLEGPLDIHAIPVQASQALASIIGVNAREVTVASKDRARRVGDEGMRVEGAMINLNEMGPPPQGKLLYARAIPVIEGFDFSTPYRFDIRLGGGLSQHEVVSEGTDEDLDFSFLAGSYDLRGVACVGGYLEYGASPGQTDIELLWMGIATRVADGSFQCTLTLSLDQPLFAQLASASGPCCSSNWRLYVPELDGFASVPGALGPAPASLGAFSYAVQVYTFEGTSFILSYGYGLQQTNVLIEEPPLRASNPFASKDQLLYDLDPTASYAELSICDAMGRCYWFLDHVGRFEAPVSLPALPQELADRDPRTGSKVLQVWQRRLTNFEPDNFELQGRRPLAEINNSIEVRY